MNSNQNMQLKSALESANNKGVYSLTTKNARNAMQFHTKREASAFAKLCGWNANDAIREDVMGFIIWVISDPHLNYLTARGALRSLSQKGINTQVDG